MGNDCQQSWLGYEVITPATWTGSTKPLLLASAVLIVKGTLHHALPCLTSAASK